VSKAWRALLVYCQEYRCSHSVAISGDAWPDDVRLSDVEYEFWSLQAFERLSGVFGRPFSASKNSVPGG
jgi:hypothetical protein